MRHRRTSPLTLGTISVLLLVLLVAPGGPVHAATITFNVDTSSDAVDASPGDGVCATAGGQCTLRAAIQEANALALANAPTIHIPVDTLTLSIGGINENAAATGDLDITTNLTIKGEGPDLSIVDADQIDRVFEIVGTHSVTITGVRIVRGWTKSPGGGISNSTGALTMENSIINDNAAAGGGGIWIGATGIYTATNVHIENNTSDDSGGGISNRGAVSMTGGSITGNVVTNTNGNGGGILNYAESASASVTLSEVTISGNQSPYGAGVYSTRSFPPYVATTTIQNSTLAGNTAAHNGGGMYNQGSMAFLTNVTISGNNSERGAGIYNTGSLNILNGTVVSNTVSVADMGGGILEDGYGYTQATFKNTIIANNNNSNCRLFGPLTSGGHNLDSGSLCGLASTGDLQNTAPSLGPLQNNGGPTFTHALLAGSPAIDAGDNSGCPATDQRGYSRPQDGDSSGSYLCDMGAYEVLGPPMPHYLYLPYIQR